MKLNYKFTICIYLIALIITMLCVLLFWATFRSTWQCKNLRFGYEKIFYLNEIEKDIGKQFKEISDILLLGEFKEAGEYNKYKAFIITNFNKWRKEVENSKQLSNIRITNLLKLQNQYLKISKDCDDIVETMLRGDKKNALEKFKKTIENDYEVEFKNIVESSIAYERDTIKNVIRKSEKSSKNIIIHNIGVYLFSISLIIVIVYLLRHSILKPILMLNKETNEISRGNLTAINIIKSKDEIGMLAGSINKMVNSIKSSFGFDYVSKRTDDFLEVVQNTSRGKYDKYCKESHRNDIFDALAVGINIMIDDIKENISEINKQKKQLEDKSNELENFVYTVSHDLKAPLVTLDGFSSKLLQRYNDKLDSKGKLFIERIKYNVNQMELLIHDLLELSRIGRVVGDLNYVDVNKIISECLRELEINLKKKKIKINISNSLPKSWGDKVRIKQVFDNLINNAIQYIGDQKKPEIEINACDRGDGFYEFYVKDNGIGIDPKYSDKVFKIFQRLQDIKTEGTGIGLTIVKRIIEYHNGKIWFESKPGKGATFFFTLPKEKSKIEMGE